MQRKQSAENLAEQNEGNNLELYLNDVFSKECLYSISQEEVDFIQTGTEFLVEEIVNYVQVVLQRYTENGKLHPAVQLLDHFPIVKVGSFFEGTKNDYPDEFDFIFCFYRQRSFILFPDFQPPIEQIVKSVCKKHKRRLKFKESHVGASRKIYFEKFKTTHGPASWLSFTYKDAVGNFHEIDVDLVPASRIYIDQETHAKNIEDICVVRPFVQEILSTESILIVRNNFSFTETEVQFMRNTLSRNHAKIYRILKFLINGHGDEKYTKMFCAGYSSFKIKTIIISHHYKCKNKDTSCLGGCILEVLEEMCQYDEDFPTLVLPEKLVDFLPTLYLRDNLKALTARLKAMQHVKGDYSYEKDRIQTSVSKQYDNQSEDEFMKDFYICCPFC